VAVAQARARVWYAAVLWGWCEATCRALHQRRKALALRPRRLRRAAWAAWRRSVAATQLERMQEGRADALRGGALTRRALAAWRIGARVSVAARAIAEGYLSRLVRTHTLGGVLRALATHRLRAVHHRAAAASLAALRAARWVPGRLRAVLAAWAACAAAATVRRSAAAAVGKRRAHWALAEPWRQWCRAARHLQVGTTLRETEGTQAGCSHSSHPLGRRAVAGGRDESAQ
jgi:hypothetical protein